MADRSLVARIVMQATDKASDALNRVRLNASGLAGKLVKLKKELNALEDTKKLANNFRATNRELITNGVAIQNNQNKLRILSARMAAAKTPTAAMRREYTALTRESDKLTKQKQKLTDKLKSLDGKLKEANFDTKNFKKSYESMSKSLRETTAAVDKQKAALERLSKAKAKVANARELSGKASSVAIKTGAAGAAMGATISAPVLNYAAAEEASTDLKVAMMTKGGSVSAEFQKVNDLAMKLGDRLPGTTADFLKLMTMLQRQGISAEAVLGGTGEAAALLSVQLKMAPEAAAEMAAKLQDATRGTEKEMVSIMDDVQRMFYAGVDSENIIPAFGKLAPALDIIKVKGKAATAMMGPLLGMLDQAGLSGESAGNALRKVFTRMMDTDRIEKATEDYNVNLDFTNGKGEFGGMPKMYRELAKLRSLTTKDRLQILRGIFGDDAETLQALNTMIEKGQAGYDEFSKKMADQASLNERVNAQLGTLKNLWDAATGTATNFLVKMGESIAPQVKGIVQWLGDAAEKMNAWATANPKTARTLMQVAAGTAAVLLAVSGLAAGLAALVMPFAILRVGFASLRIGGLVSRLFGLKSLFGIVGKTILTLGSVLLKAGGIFMRFGMVAARAISGLKALFGIVGKTISTLGSVLLKAGGIFMRFGMMAARAIMIVGRAFLTNPIGIVIAVIVGGLYLLWKNWDAVKNALARGWQWIQQVFSNNPILNFIFPIIGIARLLINNWGVIGPFFSSLWGRVKSYVTSALAAIGSAILNMPLVQYFIQKWNAVTSFMSGLGGKLMGIGRNIVQGLINGIKEKLKPLTDIWNKIASLFDGTMRKTNEIRSPSRVMARLGGYIMQGLSVGVQNGKAKLAGVYQKAVGLFQNPISVGGLVERGAAALAPFAGIPATAAPAFAGAVPVSAAMAAAGGGTTNYYITVQAAPGSNGQQIGQDIAAALREHEAAQARRRRGQFQDGD